MSRLDEPLSGGRIEELSEDECLRLLSAKSVGRVGFLGSTGPMILPVNYVLDEGSVLFRTAAYNTLGSALRNAQAAFEVDEVDDFLQAGWSVLLQGAAAYVDDPEELPQDRLSRPEPWVEGRRTLYIRITPRSITGRRVHPA